MATAVPGVTLESIERVLREELVRIADNGPTEDELARSVALMESSFLSRLQHVGGFGGKSDQLNSYNMVLGEPGFFARDLQRYRDVSRESVRRSAATYLAAAEAVTLSVVPTGHVEMAPPDSDLVVVA